MNEHKAISQYGLKELKLECATLLSRTYLELGQKSEAETVVLMSKILADDLVRDFKSLSFQDIQEAFRQGVRKTDKFHLNVKTYYHWILNYRAILWDATYQVRTMNADPKKVPHFREQAKLLMNKNKKI